MILNKRPVGPCAAMPVGRVLFRMGIGTLAHGRLDSHQGSFVMRQEAGPHQVFARVVHSFALVFVRAVAIPQAGVFHQPVDVLGRILFHVACPAEIVGHESLHAVSSGAYEHQFGQQERVVDCRRILSASSRLSRWSRSSMLNPEGASSRSLRR